MTDFTHEWIAKREELIAWFSKPFRGMPQDKVGLSILATNDFPRALAALKAVLEEHPATRLGCITHYARSDCECEPRFTCATCAVTHPCPTVAAVEAALRGES